MSAIDTIKQVGRAICGWVVEQIVTLPRRFYGEYFGGGDYPSYEHPGFQMILLGFTIATLARPLSALGLGVISQSVAVTGAILLASTILIHLLTKGFGGLRRSIAFIRRS